MDAVPIKFEFTYTRELLRAMLNTRMPRSRSNRSRLVYVSIYILGCLALGFLISVGRRVSGLGGDFSTGFLLGLMIAGLTFVFSVWWIRRGCVAAEAEAKLRRNAHEVLLDERGVISRSELGHEAFKWTAVTGVTEFKPGLLIRLGMRSPIPVPDVALPSDIDRSEVLRRIQKWREAVA